MCYNFKFNFFFFFAIKEFDIFKGNRVNNSISEFLEFSPFGGIKEAEIYFDAKVNKFTSNSDLTSINFSF